MKIEKSDQKTFTPIHIILESQEEINWLIAFINQGLSYWSINDKACSFLSKLEKGLNLIN